MAPVSTFLLQLESLNNSQQKWQSLPTGEKLLFLQRINRIASEMPLSDWEELGEWTVGTMMGISTSTPEGQAAKAAESYFALLIVKQTLDRLEQAYEMAIGVCANQAVYEKALHPTKASNGQLVLNTHPLLPKDHFGPTAGLQVEWWLDGTAKTFDLDHFDDKATEGVLVVLAAGNQSFLTLVDVLEGLFVRQRVCLCKHHPLRPALDPLLRKLFEPLYNAGYLESVLDLQQENASLVYHPLVTSLHMTGGKSTHDDIVWGSTKEEQCKNKQQNTPKLTNAEMTSELGCITPWIMAAGHYTAKELKHHAEILIMGIYGNASANCLAPKVVVLEEGWKQKDEFLQLLQQTWQQLELPVAYYPGSQQRWLAYQNAYPDAQLWQGAASPNRQLKPPMLNKGDTEATVLPLFCVDLKVDLSTPAGQAAAKDEYAFRQEPFCPVVTFVTLPAANDNYLQTATTLCNDYIYGSLSISMSVPESLKNDPQVEQAIVDLKYGSIGINCWTGMAYSFGWGGHAKQESLVNVESGLGRVGNYLFVPHVEKSVVRAPSIWSLHPKVNPNYDQAKRELQAVAKFIRAPGVMTLLSLLQATIPLPVQLGTAGAFAVAIAAITMMVVK